MPVSFDTFLFDAASQLTGGLITDVKTLLLGLLVLGFLLIGFDIIFESLQDSFQSISSSRHYNEARYYHSLMGASERGSFEYDYYRSLYNKNLSAAASGEFSRKKGVGRLSSGPSVYPSSSSRDLV